MYAYVALFLSLSLYLYIYIYKGLTERKDASWRFSVRMWAAV